MAAPRVFEDAGKIFRADTCEPLKLATEREEVDFAGWARGSYPGKSIPRGTLDGVCSLGVWDVRSQQNWGLGEHCNEGLEVTLLTRGSVGFKAAERARKLEGGQMTVTRPWQVHEVGNPNVAPSRLAWFILDVGVRRPNQEWSWPDWVLLSASERKRLSHIIQNTNQTVWTGTQLAGPFEELIDLLADGDPVTAETEAKVILNTLLIRLLKTLDLGVDYTLPSRNGAQHTVRIFLDRLKEHTEYNWSVNEMAEQCGVSRSAFIEHCRSILNVTPHSYLMSLRVDRSAHLLEHRPDLNLTEIAMTCGFGSSAYFSSAFKSQKGTSPSKYRSLRTRTEELA